MHYYCHWIDENLFSKILFLPRNYIVSFDDSLYSHYYYLPKIRKLRPDLRLIVNITTSFLNPESIIRETYESGKHLEFVDCDTYMYNYLQDNLENFMTFAELDYLYQIGIEVSAHSHYHKPVLIFGHPGKNNWPYEYYNLKSRNFINYRSALSIAGFEFKDNKFQRRSQETFEKFVEEDTDLCFETLSKLNIKTNMYCLPFNDRSLYLETYLLKYVPFIVGPERKELV
jgi:hypothetical protein